MAAGLAILFVAVAIVWAATGGLDRMAADRIETALVEQGLPQPLAYCMGERLSQRLSFGQLRTLQAAAEDATTSERQFVLPAFLERIRRLDDPHIVEVAASSAAICAFAGG